jgi:hypothetical protein
MVYAKYFRPGQRILLRVLEPPGRFEALTAIFQQSGSGCFVLTLVSQARAEENYPFVTGMSLVLMSDQPAGRSVLSPKSSG